MVVGGYSGNGCAVGIMLHMSPSLKSIVNPVNQWKINIKNNLVYNI